MAILIVAVFPSRLTRYNAPKHSKEGNKEFYSNIGKHWVTRKHTVTTVSVNIFASALVEPILPK